VRSNGRREAKCHENNISLIGPFALIKLLVKLDIESALTVYDQMKAL
jgi:hypothetical protein